jgi:hypothetical protein
MILFFFNVVEPHRQDAVPTYNTYDLGTEMFQNHTVPIKEITNNFEVKITVTEEEFSVALVPRQHLDFRFKQQMF